MRASALLVVAVSVLGVSGCHDDPPARTHRPLDTYAAYDPSANGPALVAAAAARAKAEKKRVLLTFGGNWCKWCKALDGLMETDARLRAVLERSFVVVHVDSDTNVAMNTAYGNPFSKGFPVMLVLDDDGQILQTQESGVFEREDKGVGHDPDKVLVFLRRWAPG